MVIQIKIVLLAAGILLLATWEPLNAGSVIAAGGLGALIERQWVLFQAHRRAVETQKSIAAYSTE